MTDLDRILPLLDAFVVQQMQAASTPGVALALTSREHLLHTAAYGYADVAAQKPVPRDALFEIGSISKSFTAIALLQLAEAGRLDLRAPLTRYLPWFQVTTRYEPIAIHHLLSHTAGIIRGTDFSTEAHYEVWALRDTETSAPPGTTFHYSNVGYKALGLVLEALLGQSYGAIIQERLLDPLGMAASEPVITHETRKRLAVGYEPFYDDRPAHPCQGLVPATWLESGTGDGSIAATAADMAAYVRMLLNRGRGPAGPLLSQKSFRSMIQGVIEYPPDEDDPGTWYGYGLETRQEEGQTVIGHGGGMVGYYSAIRADLDGGLGVVVLVNGPGEPGAIARYALRLLRAAHHGRALPALPPAPEPARVENAPDYAGAYRSGEATFTLAAEGEQLVMRRGEDRVVLEKRGEDQFYLPVPDSRYLLRFGREAEQVVEAFHGPDWYIHGRYSGALAFATPPEWDAYPGHYRSHNPWQPNFRVVLRKGKLLLIEPRDEEQALVPVGDRLFRVGEDEHSPERLSFGPILGGQAIHANLSGCDYYRTFTP
jgi:CubicO group peptidase (beta-lactamase class C family)